MKPCTLLIGLLLSLQAYGHPSKELLHELIYPLICFPDKPEALSRFAEEVQYMAASQRVKFLSDTLTPGNLSYFLLATPAASYTNEFSASANNPLVFRCMHRMELGEQMFSRNDIELVGVNDLENGMISVTIKYNASGAFAGEAIVVVENTNGKPAAKRLYLKKRGSEKIADGLLVCESGP